MSLQGNINIPEVRNSSFQRSGNLDPARVMPRCNNQATIYLDTISQYSVSAINKAETLLSSGPNASQLTHSIRRLAPRSFSISWYIPNCNPRNNTITFWSSNTSIFHTVTVPESFYMIPGDLIGAIVTALNTLTGITGLTFGSLVNTYGTSYIENRYIINCTGGDYYFKNDCTAITRGKTLWALPEEQIASNSKSTGFMNLRYTNYINISSGILTRYSKLNASSNELTSNNSLLARIIISDSGKFDLLNNPLAVPYGILTENISTDLSTNWFNMDIDQPLSLIDIKLSDQYGELLYIPDQSGIDWSLFISIQGP